MADTPMGVDARDALLTATAEVIAERGWLGATTRAVAQRAGVNQGLVHYYFGSVEAMRQQAADRVMEQAVGQLAMPLMTAPTLADGLRAIAPALGGYDIASSDAAVFLEASLGAARDERTRDHMAGMLREFRTALVAQLARPDEGSGEPDDARPTATIVAALIDGLLLHRLIDPSLDIEAAVRMLAELIENKRDVTVERDVTNELDATTGHDDTEDHA